MDTPTHLSELFCGMQPRDVGLPVNAYVAREQVKPEGTEKAQQVFVHLPTAVSQTEAEEIGVEHLLRDVKDATISTLSTDIVSQAQVQLSSALLVSCAPAGGSYGFFLGSCCLVRTGTCAPELAARHMHMPRAAAAGSERPAKETGRDA